MTQPNILLIMADQLAAQFVGAYGGPALTPAIDRLAGQGVVFDSAYTPSPLCAPARFAMMAGQLNSRIGAYDNAAEFPSSMPTFVHHLRSSGYQTSLIGKMHFIGADQLHGFEERLTTDIYPADFGWTPDWENPDDRFDWWFHNLDSVVNAGVADATNQLDFDDDVGNATIKKLRDLSRTTDDRPWFVAASFTHPHDPYVARQEYWDLYDHNAVPMPTTSSSHVEELDPHSVRLRHVIGADVSDVSEAEVRNARHAYLANCSYVDEWVRRIVATVDHHSMGDDTVIMFASDHGDMLGERGLWYKMSFFEHSCRIPLIMHNPARFEPRRVSSHVSLLDVGPTFVELAGAQIPSAMDGDSLLSLGSGLEDPDRTVVGEYLGEGAVAPIFMIRRGPLKYVWSESDDGQLYDLVEDPRELQNLADNPEYADALEWFRSELHDRWDHVAIRAQVVASQRNRRTVDHALRRGRYASWDFHPHLDASGQYMRNHLDLNEVESRRRSG